MKVTFRNIGPIEEAVIDLTKGLSIFCGPNNTGKTYLAYCLYGLHKLRDTAGTITAFRPGDYESLDGVDSVNIIAFYREHRTNIQRNLKREFESSLESIFGLSATLTDQLFPEASIALELPDDEAFEMRLKQHQISTVLKFGSGEIMSIEKNANDENISLALAVTQGNKRTPKLIISRFVLDRIYAFIVSALLPKSFIAPVERNSIFTFSKELAIQRNELVEEMLRLKDTRGKHAAGAALLERRAMRYPMPVRDGLEIAEDLANYQKQKSEFTGLADALEAELLQGRILIGKEGEVLFSPNKSKSTKLPIHLGASVVKSLSGLVIYFRHLATAGDFIIIDEPELNLHPDAQIIVARIIARIVNEGFKVLINTHSDYIIREINNLIMLSAIDDSKVEAIPEEYNVEPTIALMSENVGAYLFHYQTGRSKNKVAVDILPIESTGFEVETIDRVISTLNSTSQELYYLLNTTEEEEDAE